MPNAPRAPAWLDDRASVLGVVVLAVLWTIASIASPAAMRSLHLDPSDKPTEGPFEWVQNAMLVASIGLWAYVAWRTRGDRLPSALATLMAIQVVVLLGEEVDWGQALGLNLLGGQRNLRRLLHDHGVLSEPLGAGVVMGFLGVFFVWPLVPIGAVQRWLERAAPVRAEAGDALAILGVLLSWMIMARLLGAGPSFEFVQTGGYLVLGVVSARAALGTGRARPPPTGAAAELNDPG